MKLFIALLLLPFITLAQPIHCDYLIINGKIVDGTGNNWYYGTVAIKDGKIIYTGQLPLLFDAVKTIDATGLIVAPGFIDVHTHLEGNEAKEPLAKNFIYDGVTTCITGNCGSSEVSMKKYFALIDSLKLSINIGALIGHNDVREKVMGKANREPTVTELTKMKALVETAMKEGAMGFSTGLIYTPGTYSKTNEIVELAKVASRYKGLYATHMRDEGDSIAQAVEEALQIARLAQLPLEISHYKLSGQQNWGRSKETIGLIEQAREQGIDVTIDQYPYTASSTTISQLIPDEILADGQDSITTRLSRPEVQKNVIFYMLKNLKKRKLKHFTYVVIANYKADTTLNGLNIEEANLRKGRKHTAEEEARTIMEIVRKGSASGVFHGMSEEDVKYIMQYPYNMIASDASIRVLNSGVPHPRGYGTNARVLARYVREERVLRLEDAIRKMTSLPAQKFQLNTKGLLKEGMDADVVVFDANTVRENSTFSAPHAYSTGFTYVWVNGVLTVNNGTHTGARAGKPLYGPGLK